MGDLLDKFIYVYKDVKIDHYDLIHDLKQFINANTGEVIDFRTCNGKDILNYVLEHLK